MWDSYLEALREIKNSGVQLRRNVYAVYAPDEEIGGKDGVGSLIETKEFEELNAGFDIDESGPSPLPIAILMTSERLTTQVRFTAHGNTGHGSQFIEGTAIEKLLPVINTVMALREQEYKKYNALGENRLALQGQVTSVNLTMLEGGKQQNVVPATFSVTFDIRVTPKQDIVEFKKMLSDLAEKHGVECHFINPENRNPVTEWDSESNFFKCIDNVCAKHNVTYKNIICPGATDARYIRRKGIPAVGFCPLLGHPLLAHDHDEYVREPEYLKAIRVYVDLISELANA
ncbi:Aminoacylase-1 [Zancudomyces culisetae]|uniref:Aminoacylase-1 n=1 Tax=Zancudomyces culisetae TaxID=1213189 RepID=A0A1R1PYK4_ZANCU|nr:Aminoacylase-1 [Zancudomyces culisetae]|eukprot:OMH86033.1 Aminoacylase-1 [Zancudomyces culisetae]